MIVKNCLMNVKITKAAYVYQYPNENKSGIRVSVGDVYGIQLVDVDSQLRLWGYLKSGAGWIMLSGVVKEV